MDPRPYLHLAPERRLTMTFALRQALEVLQMSQLELSQWLEGEAERNPLLELKGSLPKKSFVVEPASEITLHEHLLAQIRDCFPSERQRMLAEACLHALDERGFITALPEGADEVLGTLQTFDPPGIFARDLRESFLLQLRAKGKGAGLSFQMVRECFDDLIHQRYKKIEKKLGVADLGPAIAELAALYLRPSYVFRHEIAVPIHADLVVTRVAGGWTLELFEEALPKVEIREQYCELEPEVEEEKEALRQFKVQAKLVFRALDRRRKWLLTLGRLLVRKQSAFLDQKGPLVPVTVRELSEEMGVHESTLSRALSGKYASTPRGIIALRSLVQSAPLAQSAREILEKLVRNEDRNEPLTDDRLAAALEAQGFHFSRRTVAKYRSQLKIGSAAQRKRQRGATSVSCRDGGRGSR